MKAGASGFNPYPSTTQQFPEACFHIRATALSILHGVFRIPFEREVDRFDGALCTGSTHSFVGRASASYSAGVAR